jgi:hypothetical protein
MVTLFVELSENNNVIEPVGARPELPLTVMIKSIWLPTCAVGGDGFINVVEAIAMFICNILISTID